jgi:putative hemolysin
MQIVERQDPISLSGLLHEPLRSLLHPMEPAIQKLFSFDRLQELYDAARETAGGTDAMERVLGLLGIDCQFDAAEWARIPRTGPVVVVANHPFGLLEGVILAVLLPKVRPDVKILANSVLAVLPELRGRCIFVDPFGRRDAIRGNVKALKESLAWVTRGGLLAAFPAGEVAHLDWKEGAVLDPPWHHAAARIANAAGASVVPIYFEGGNSLAFHVAGTVHPRLRTVSLPRELLNKRGQRIRIRAGRPVTPETLRWFGSSRDATGYLRCRTLQLGRAAPPPMLRKPALIVLPEPRRRLAAELARLPRERKLCEANELAVYVGSMAEIPGVVREIGRLREISFRGAGEGTGRSFDLDRFDRHYLHLLLWNHATDEVVGAYRLGATPDILPRYGVGGLYTHTLFHYRKELLEATGPALELGRSFVRPEYQRQYAPLLLLWKGIGRYVAGRPECGALFGGVSISNAYQPLSRHLMVKFLEAHRMDALAPLVRPRRPYRAHASATVQRVPADLDELSALVSDLESDGKGVPVLVKQYLKAGGKLLAFNVDRGFSDALDGLILVDLRSAPECLLKRLLGADGAAAFAAAARRLSPAAVR